MLTGRPVRSWVFTGLCGDQLQPATSCSPLHLKNVWLSWSQQRNSVFIAFKLREIWKLMIKNQADDITEWCKAFFFISWIGNQEYKNLIVLVCEPKLILSCICVSRASWSGRRDSTCVNPLLSIFHSFKKKKIPQTLTYHRQRHFPFLTRLFLYYSLSRSQKLPSFPRLDPPFFCLLHMRCSQHPSISPWIRPVNLSCWPL